MNTNERKVLSQRPLLRRAGAKVMTVKGAKSKVERKERTTENLNTIETWKYGSKVTAEETERCSR